MFEGQYTSTDQGLPELISEIRGSIRSFRQNFLWCLIQPSSFCRFFLPGPISVKPRIGGNVYCRSCQWKGSLPAGKPITNFSTRASGRPVERFHRCWKIVG